MDPTLEIWMALRRVIPELITCKVQQILLNTKWVGTSLVNQYLGVGDNPLVRTYHQLPNKM